MGIVLQIVYTVLVLGFLIFIHELGHFTAARIFKVQINEFSLGFGPMLIGAQNKKFLHIFQKKKKEEDDNEAYEGTKYALRLLPIGGFVSMEGENEESPNKNAFNQKPAWQRLIIIVAGVFMNIVVAFILTAILICVNSPASTTVAVFPNENTASAQSGLQVNDKIIKIGNTKVSTFVDISSALQDTLTKEGTSGSVEIVVLRDGKEVILPDVELPYMYITTGELVTDENLADNTDVGRTMTIDFKVYPVKITFVSFFTETFKEMGSYIKLMYKTFFQLFTGKMSLEYVSGPVGTSSVISQAASAGIVSLMYIVSLISINLAVFNLLPFPALDGGRAVFILIEMIFRRKVNPKIEAGINAAGMILLFGLMIVITFKDIFFPIN